MQKIDEKKVIQLIEVRNEIYAVYLEDQKTGFTFSFSRIIFATLCDKGYIFLHDIDSSEAIFSSCDEMGNFHHYHYGDPSTITLSE